MTADEAADWRAFYELEPWGDLRADWHAARVAWTLASVFSGRRGGGPKFQDFLFPSLEMQPRQQTPEAMAEKAKILAAMMGGRIEEA